MKKYNDFIQSKKNKLSQLLILVQNWDKIDPKRVSDIQIKRLTKSVPYYTKIGNEMGDKLFYGFNVPDQGNEYLLWYAVDSKLGYRKMTEEEFNYLNSNPVKQIKKDLKNKKSNMAKQIIASFEKRNKETYYK